MEDQISARLKQYIINSNDALELKLIRTPKDIEDDSIAFKPEMSHQVYGDSETIFGYKNLKIKLYYAAGCLETYLGVSYSEKICKLTYDGVEADDVLTNLRAFLSPDVDGNIDSFVESLKADEIFKPMGELLHSFCIDDNNRIRHFEVYKADMTTPDFKEYHVRFRTFLLWYIDAANFVDIDDDRWHYFNLFEKYSSDNGDTRYASAGFATVYQYYAYPTHTRPRIAQVLVLPPFQKIGLGSHLLRAIYLEYISRNEVKDITVEDPSEDFQRIRDFVDATNCRTLPSFSKDNLLLGFSKKMAVEASEKFKINRKQARRVYEILRLHATNLANESEYREYRLDVKKRLNAPYKKEQNDIKKLEAALKRNDSKGSGSVTLPIQEERLQILEKEYNKLEEEYKKVVKRLDKTSD